MCTMELTQRWGQGLAADEQNASLPSDLFIDSGVWGPLMDEQPHYLGISFPGSQMQRVTAFRVGHVGQSIIPEKNLNHIPRRQKSIMSWGTNSSFHLFSTTSFHRSSFRWLPSLYLSSSPSLFLLYPELLVELLIRGCKILSQTTLTHHLPLYLGFLDNPPIFHYSENVWLHCLINLAMFPCLWCLNSIQG